MEPQKWDFPLLNGKILRWAPLWLERKKDRKGKQIFIFHFIKYCEYEKCQMMTYECFNKVRVDFFLLNHVDNESLWFP